MVYGRQSHIHVHGWYWLQCFINLPKGKFNSTIKNTSFQIIIYHSLSSRSSRKEEELDENELDWAKSCSFAHKINRFEYKSNDLKFYFIEFWTIVFTHHLIELFALISLLPANAANGEVLVNAYWPHKRKLISGVHKKRELLNNRPFGSSFCRRHLSVSSKLNSCLDTHFFVWHAD